MVRTFSVRWRAAVSVVQAAYFLSRRLAPVRVIRASSEVDALRSSVQAPVKFSLSGSGWGAAEDWVGLKTPSHARAASERSRKCLIKVESLFHLTSLLDCQF